MPFCLWQGKEPTQLCQKGCPCALFPPTSPSHTGDQCDNNNSPLARHPRTWKSQITFSSPPVPHQQQWCLGEGRAAVVSLHGEGRGGMATERSSHTVTSRRDSGQPCSAHWAHGLLAPAALQGEPASRLHCFLGSQHTGTKSPRQVSGTRDFFFWWFWETSPLGRLG